MAFVEEKEENKLRLLSVSADKTVIIWHRDLNVDTWVENYRLGDVGGNVSGFLGGRFSPSGEFLMGHDLRGAFHVWKYNVGNLKIEKEKFFELVLKIFVHYFSEINRYLDPRSSALWTF